MVTLINEIGRLALGGAQFGNRYGIASSSNMSDTDAIEIIKTAYSAGVTTFDTAAVYGSSEAIFGSANIGPLNIITKLPPIPLNCINVEQWTHEQVFNSLKRLRIDQIYGLLLHNPIDLVGVNGSILYSALCRLKEQGLIKLIGVSIYSPYELSDIWGKYEIDIVQAPYNIFDQRIEESGWAAKIGDSGMELHIRSIFLQGLLLMDPDSYPSYFYPWRNLLDKWKIVCSSNNYSPLEACVGFAINSNARKVVIGVQSLSQCLQVTNAWENSKNKGCLDGLACKDLRLIDPRQWNLKK